MPTAIGTSAGQSYPDDEKRCRVTLEVLLTGANLQAALIWLAAGVVIGWRRGVAPTLWVPLILAVVPAAISLPGGGGELVRMDQLNDAASVLALIVIPFVACVLGGHVAAALSPEIRSRREALLASRVAARRASAIAAELYPNPTASAPSPAARQSAADFLSQRLERYRVAQRSDDLRALRRRVRTI